MATVQEMKATARPKGGKGAARAARRSGRVPGVIYGENKPPLMVLLDHDELRHRIYAGRFLTTLYELTGHEEPRRPVAVAQARGQARVKSRAITVFRPAARACVTAPSQRLRTRSERVSTTSSDVFMPEVSRM